MSALVLGAQEPERRSIGSRAVEISAEIQDEERRASALVAVAEAAPPDIQEGVVAVAGELGLEGRVLSAARLALLTTGTTRSKAIALALQTAREVVMPDYFTDLPALVEVLDDDQLELLMTRTREWEWRTGTPLVLALLRRLPSDRHHELLPIVGESLAGWFPEEVDRSCLPYLVEVAEADPDPGTRAMKLAEYLPLLEGEAAERVRQRFLDTIASFEEGIPERLRRLSSVLTPDAVWPEAVEVADALVAELAEGQEELPGSLLGHLAVAHPVRFDQYVGIAANLQDSKDRIGALWGLARYAPPGKGERIVELAIDLVVDPSAGYYRLDRWLADVLRPAAPLDDNAVEAIAARLLEIRAGERVQALIGLASAATRKARTQVLATAFEHARHRPVGSDPSLLVLIAELCEPAAAGAVLAEALRTSLGPGMPTDHGVGRVIEVWTRIAFEGIDEDAAPALDAVTLASSVGRSYLLDVLSEIAPLLRHVIGDVASAAMAADIDDVCRRCAPPRPRDSARKVATDPAGAGEITVQAGMQDYMRRASGACHIMVRKADDTKAVRDALEGFVADLYRSDLFASLDGQFGTEPDGTDIRYTPSFASTVTSTDEGETFWFDADDVLEAWPHVTHHLIAQLRDRLVEAGVGRAEIGKPTES